MRRFLLALVCCVPAFGLAQTESPEPPEAPPKMPALFEMARLGRFFGNSDGCIAWIDESLNQVVLSSKAVFLEPKPPGALAHLPLALIGLQSGHVALPADLQPRADQPPPVPEPEDPSDSRTTSKRRKEPPPPIPAVADPIPFAELEQGFRQSDDAFFVKMLRRIDPETLANLWPRVQFSGVQFNREIGPFWNDGTLAVHSGVMTHFLKNLAEGKLKLQPSVQEAVRRLAAIRVANQVEGIGRETTLALGAQNKFGWHAGWFKTAQGSITYSVWIQGTRANGAEARAVAEDVLKTRRLLP